MFLYIVSSRRLQDMSWRHLQDMSSRLLQDRSSGRLQDMSSRRLQTCLQDVFSVTIFRLPRRLCETLSRRLGRRKIVTLRTCWRRLQDMSWRPLQDVFKTNKCLLGRLEAFFWKWWLCLVTKSFSIIYSRVA